MRRSFETSIPPASLAYAALPATLCMLLVTSAIAQDCLGPGETIHKAAHIDGVGWLDGEIEGDRLVVHTSRRSIEPPYDIEFEIEQFDLTDPFNPVLLGKAPILGRYEGMTVDGETAVFIENNNPFGCLGTMLPVDLSAGVPRALWPVPPRVDEGETAAHGVFAKDGILYSVTYQACGQFRLDLFDISDPTIPPVGIGFVLLPIYYEVDALRTCIAIQNGYAFLIVETGDFLVVDVSNPASPVFVEQLTLHAGRARIETYGSYAYVMREGAELYVVDISDPESPTLANTVAIGGRDFGLHDDRLYVFHTESLGIYDLEDPLLPTLCGWLDYTFDTTEGIAFQDELAYVGHGRADVLDYPVGIEVFDLSSGEVGQPLFEFPIGANAGDLEIVGTTAFVTRGAAGGIGRVDLTDLFNPVLLPRLGTSNYASVAAEGSRLAAITNSSLHLYEISPFGASLRSELPFDGDQVELEGELCAVRNGGQIEIVDVSDLDAPFVVSSIPYGGHFSFHSSLLAIASSSSGTRIYSLEDPTDPVLTAQLPDDDHSPVRCELEGTTLLVTELWARKIQIYDLTDPFALEHVGTLPYPRLLASAGIDGPNVFVNSSSGQSSVHAWNISDPTAPTQTYMIHSPLLNLTGDLLDGHPVITAGQRGIAVFPSICKDPAGLPAPETTRWIGDPSGIRVSPSPGTGERLTFSWSEHPSDDQIDIIDVAGRRVHTMMVPRNAPSLDWIAPGRLLTPGVYWAKWANERAAGARFVFIR